MMVDWFDMGVGFYGHPSPQHNTERGEQDEKGGRSHTRTGKTAAAGLDTALNGLLQQVFSSNEAGSAVTSRPIQLITTR